MELPRERSFVMSDGVTKNTMDLYGNGSLSVEKDFNGLENKYYGHDLTNKSLISIREGGAGDLLFKTPFLKYLKEKYPSLDLVVSRIHRAEMLVRSNLVLTKKNIPNCEKFIHVVNDLRKIGFDHVSAWPIRNSDDKKDLSLSPLEEELDKMSEWVEKNQEPNFRLRLLNEKSRVVYQAGQKLTLFPDGKLSSSWCN